MTLDPMNFQNITDCAEQAANGNVIVPESWGQGRATFGGMVAALIYQQMTSVVSEGRPLRSLTVSFVAPVAPGEMKVSVRLLREGKAATQVEATGYQDDQAVAVLLASFGGDRQSVINIQGQDAPDMKAPDDAQTMPFVKGFTPDFTQHYDYRYAIGGMPFTGSTLPQVGGWIRQQTASERAISVADILGLVDAWPPVSLTLLKQPSPGSSLTWTINFVAHDQAQTASDWWQYLAKIESAGDGYSHIDAKLWDANGKLAVISRQTVSTFA